MKLIFPKYLYYKNKFYPDYGVLTEGDSIISVEPKKQLLEKYPQAKQLHLSEQVLLPGAVNAHNHCFQSLLRGIAADRPFPGMERPIPVLLFSENEQRGYL